MPPSLTLHALPPSHPCMTVDAALRLKGLDFERVDLAPGEHTAEMQRLYGDGRTTVPGLMVDGEPVHGSRAILARLEALAPDPALYPADTADTVREAEAEGVMGGEQATAADLQIGATLRVLLTVEDLHGLLRDRPAEQVARRWFAGYPGQVPAGAYPAGWVPAR